MNWYLGVFTKYAIFSGRARRKEYWMFYLFNMIAVLALCILGSAIDEAIGLVLVGAYALFSLIPNISVTVRRLHDINRSGWWFLLIFVPLLNIVLFVFTLLEGTQGDNEYGSDPKKMP
ncbi:DUF805 domain-containing protein [Xenorhabdus sp. PB62.4]|uniref:DUF805 domain-containing protein n=1 Tax=Xenorhabdus sp. PB62.4 TaxID=1851573 RepID=UPI0016575C47|nr:DUF805 domain-containing protein [Xenorhabdus sp. PB62.4]MBC8952167.1 membrane protein [Xenorhabdus sp. PB62.4]